jgi:hypothetical protein
LILVVNRGGEGHGVDRVAVGVNRCDGDRDREANGRVGRNDRSYFAVK